MSRFNFTTAEALEAGQKYLLEFPLGRMLKWSLIALSVSVVVVLLDPFECTVAGRSYTYCSFGYSHYYYEAASAFQWNVYVLPQAGVVVFWAVRHLRSVAA